MDSDSGGLSLEDVGTAACSSEAYDFAASSVVIRPYAIEEPDDDPNPAAQKERPCLPDSLECWQRDLVDYLDCDSDIYRVAKPHAKQARGQKRKPANTAGIGHYYPLQSHSPGPKTRSDAAQSMTPGLSPKRRRRRSKLPRGDAKAVRSGFSMHDFRECTSTGSSSPDLRSGDVSSVDTMNDSSIVDEMDID